VLMPVRKELLEEFHHDHDGDKHNVEEDEDDVGMIGGKDYLNGRYLDVSQPVCLVSCHYDCVLNMPHLWPYMNCFLCSYCGVPCVEKKHSGCSYCKISSTKETKENHWICAFNKRIGWRL